MKQIIKYFRYNVQHNNIYNQTLHNVLIENYHLLPKIFYKIIFKYVSPYFFHLFMEELVDISFDVYNYSKLADKICYIDKQMLNCCFKLINYYYSKSISPNFVTFNKELSNKSIKAMRYHNNDTLQLNNCYEKLELEILMLLHNRFKERIIINYIIYLLCANYYDLEYDMFEKEIKDKEVFTNVYNIQNIFTNIPQENQPLYTDYFNKKRHD